MKRLIVLLAFLLSAGVLSGCDSLSSDEEFVVLDGPILETVAKTGEFEFNGAVTNISNKPVTSVFVVILLKDEDGEIIETNSVGVIGESEDIMLMPGESEFFTLDFKTDPSTALSKEVEIYYDEPDS